MKRTRTSWRRRPSIFALDVGAEDPHQALDLGERPLPVLGREGVERQVGDAEVGTGPDDLGHAPRAARVAVETVHAARRGPAAVAVHDDPDVKRRDTAFLHVAHLPVSLITHSQRCRQQDSCAHGRRSRRCAAFLGGWQGRGARSPGTPLAPGGLPAPCGKQADIFRDAADGRGRSKQAGEPERQVRGVERHDAVKLAIDENGHEEEEGAADDAVVGDARENGGEQRQQPGDEARRRVAQVRPARGARTMRRA